MKNIYLLLLLSFITLSTQAQNAKTATITWTISEMVDVSSGTRETNAPVLTTYGSTRATLQLGDGSVKEYPISATVGEWSNVQQDGEMVYGIDYGNQSGSLTIMRKNNTLTGRIVLSNGEETTITELFITKLTVL